MAATAAALPPLGVVTNFEDPPSKAQTVYIVMSICLVLVTLLVAIRVYTRARITKSLWWDDCKPSVAARTYLLLCPHG